MALHVVDRPGEAASVVGLHGEPALDGDGVGGEVSGDPFIQLDQDDAVGQALRTEFALGVHHKREARDARLLENTAGKDEPA